VGDAVARRLKGEESTMAYTSDAKTSQQYQGPRSGDDRLAADMQHVADEAADAMKHRTREMADEAKDKGSDQMAGVSRAVHEAADRLGEELPQAAGYIHSAAAQLDSASAALRERSIEDLIGSFSSFARRQPAAAFAGSVLAGFALSRFLKSSAPHTTNTTKRD
jgi:hypothetical protein